MSLRREFANARTPESRRVPLARVAHGEPFRREQVISFALIGVAVALYIAEAARTRARA